MKKSSTFFLLSFVIIALVANACSQDSCRSLDPAAQINIRVSNDLAMKARSLKVTINREFDSRTRIFDLDDELMDRETSLVVNIVPAPAGKFQLEVTVSAYDGEQGQGTLLGMDQRKQSASPDSCNQFSLMISFQDFKEDAGVVDDAATADTFIDSVEDAGAMDVDPVDVGFMDADPVDVGFKDAASRDTGPVDTGIPDAGQLCVESTDPDTVALYTFNTTTGTTVKDETMAHHGQIEDMNGVRSIFGPRIASGSTCGTAVSFDGSYIVVPDASDFQLSVGSIDLWVKIAGTATAPQGVISRDAENRNLPGHLTIFRTCMDHIVLRVQDDSLPSVHECSDLPIPRNVWTHIGVNLGPPEVELYINSVRTTHTGTVTMCNISGGTWSVQCGQSGSLGISGNFNPWVFGASSAGSEEGSNLPIGTGLQGAIDNVRISSVRRGF